MTTLTQTAGLGRETDAGPGVLVYLVAGIYTTLSMVSGFFLPVFFSEQLGFTGMQIGFLFAMQAVTIMIAAAPAGLGNDWVTSRFLIVAGLAGQAVGLALMGMVTNFWTYVPVFFLWSIAGGLFKVSLDVQLLKTASGDQRIRGVYYFQTSRYVGGSLGCLGAGYLLSLVSFSSALTAVAVALVVLALLAMRLPATRLEPGRLGHYAKELRRPRVLVMGALLVLFASHWGAEMTSYGLYLQNDRSLDWTEMGAYLAAEMAAILILLGWLLRWPRVEPDIGRLAAWGLVASGVGQVLMVLGPLWFSVVSRMVHGMGDGAIFLVFYLGVPRLFALERLGGHAGVVHFMSMVGTVAGSLLYGHIGEDLGYGVPLWTSGLVTCGLAILLLVHRLSNRPSTTN